MVDAKRRRLWRPRCSLCKQLALDQLQIKAEWVGQGCYTLLSYRYSNQCCIREARRVSRSVIAFATSDF